MTQHKFENKLRDEAESFIKKMLQEGTDIEPYTLTFSDYLVKIAIQDKVCDSHTSFQFVE